MDTCLVSEWVGFEQILRTCIPAEYRDSRVADLLQFCSRTGCRDVMIFTSLYDGETSFKSPETAAEYTKHTLIPAAEALRAAGIRVHLNVTQTLGHVFFPKEAEAEFPFARRVTLEGYVSQAGACPLDANLQHWIGELYRIYAAVRPDTLWIDDDFRTMLDKGLYCFCDKHLQRYSQVAGYAVTRDAMRQAILSENYPPSPLRQVYFSVTTDVFCHLASTIRECVKSVSPGTQLGVMCAVWPHGAAGIEWQAVLDALCGAETPLMRPQCPVYSEWSLHSTALSLIAQDLFRAMMPSSVTHWPELDCYPFSNFAKSHRTTLAQLYGQMLTGFNHHAVQYFPQDGSRFAEIESPVEHICQHGPYFDAVHAAVAEGSRPGGVYCYRHPRGLIVRRSGDSWLYGHKLDEYLALSGIPVGFFAVGDGPCIASGDDLLAADDAEIDSLLRRGLMLDVPALEALTLRGYGERIGVDCSMALETARIGYERFVGADGTPRQQPLRPFLGKSGHWRILRPLANCKFTMDSAICDCHNEVLGPMLAWSENSRGERFAVYASDLDGSEMLMLHRHRTEQLQRSLSYLGILPVAAASCNPYLELFLNRDRDNNPVLGILNFSSDRYEAFYLRVSLCFRDVEYLRMDGTWEQAPYSSKLQEGGYSLLKMEISLGTLEFATLRFLK